MFINAQPILGVLDMYRIVWISGRFGGHKTALAFQIAKTYLERGYNLVTNSRSVWADDINDVTLNNDNQLHSVVILDEGGLYFKSSKQIEMIASYAAKMDVVYLIPSFWPPTRSAQIINIQPVISLKATGLPIIVYKWTIKIGHFKDNGWFLWWNPKEIYGIYSRQDPGDDPESIIEFLIKNTEEFRRRYGRKASNKLLELEAISEGDKILEASEVIAASADSMSSIPKRKRRKRR